MNDANSSRVLTGCDLEPVQFLGSIQPFGVLLALHPAEFKITHASQNCAEAFDRPMSSILGVRIDQILGSQFVHSLERGDTTIRTDHWMVTIQRSANQLVLELEPIEKTLSSILVDRWVLAKEVTTRLHNSSTLLDLCQSAAIEMQKFTDFDRVMIYRFHEDLHGEVIAEKVKAGVDSYLGLHYPASDIPAPARAVFQNNWLRMIPTIEYTSIPIVGGGPLDLTQSLLRSVSPIHLEYLKNMEVGASITVSLLLNGKLWGPISCHHLEKKFVSIEDRSVCELVGRLTSSLLQAKEDLGHMHEKDRVHECHQVLQQQLQECDDIAVALMKQASNLLDLVPASGVATFLDGRWTTLGKVPAFEHLVKLAGWLKHKKQIYSTQSLPEVYPAAIDFRESGCGLLALPIPKGEGSFILWFRPELIQTVTWAGNPEKASSSKEIRMHPRQSFQAWKQTVELKSDAWMPWEIEAAKELRNSILGVDLQRQFTRAEKARVIAEEAVQAREDLMAVVSHDLKNPISAIELNLVLLFRLAPPEKIETLHGPLERIRRSTQMMKRLIDDILDITRIETGNVVLSRAPVDTREVVEEAVEMMSLIASEKKLEFVKSVPSIQCNTVCDRGRLLQVISNLTSNAIKFTPHFGKIILGVELSGTNWIKFSVSDTGPGIPKENLFRIFDRFWQAKETKKLGTGLGLAIARGIVSAHGGDIWAESEFGQGTTFYFTLPVIYS